MGSLRLEALSLRYPGRDLAAVTDVSLEIRDGEFLVLVGPSGCGKSTTLRLIAGFLVPDAGRILADGAVLSEPGRAVPPERRNMAMVFQSFAVWPHLTVFENVAFGLRARRVAARDIAARVEEMLRMVDLAGSGPSYPSQLSGGQQQRVALARALVVQPRTLLLDEPLSSLDARLRERMCDELKDLQRRTGVTFVHVTHDQSEAVALGDRVAVMHEGRIEQVGPPREVYLRPRSRDVAEAMGAVNLIAADVVAVGAGSAEIELLSSPPLRLRVRSEQPPAIGSRAVVALRPEDVTLAEPGAGGVPGLVEGSTFRGTLAEHLVRIEGDGPAAPLRLRAHTLGRRVHAPGSVVAVLIDGERCSLLG